MGYVTSSCCRCSEHAVPTTISCSKQSHPQSPTKPIHVVASIRCFIKECTPYNQLSPKSNPLTIKQHPENSVRRYPCLLKRECSRITQLDRSSIISPLALGHLDLLHILTWGVLPCTETQQLGNCPQQIHT